MVDKDISIQSFLTTVKSIEAQQVRLRLDFEAQRQQSEPHKDQIRQELGAKLAIQREELGGRVAKIEAQNDLTASRSQVGDADRFLMYRANRSLTCYEKPKECCRKRGNAWKDRTRIPAATRRRLSFVLRIL